MAVRPSPFARLREPDAITAPPRELAREALSKLQQGQKEQQEAKKVTRRTFRSWSEQVPEAKAGPLNFRDFAFQRELYEEAVVNAREVRVKKCTQGGFSAWAVRVALYHADIRGRTSLYVFPKDRHLRDFSNMRIRPVVRKSEYLRTRLAVDSIDNVGLKQIGLGFIAFRGSESEDGLDSVDADVLILDEYDTLDQGNIGSAEQRVTAPGAAGLIFRLGVPSVPEWGISKLYDSSDQRVWTVRCDECREWNPLQGNDGFRTNVDQERLLVVCHRCREPLDVRKGEWVAIYPDRDVRGYHLPKYAIYGVDLAGIVERSKDRRPLYVARFHNKDLGEDYSPKEGRLSREQLVACSRRDLHLVQGITTANLVTMGVDVKSTGNLHVTISEHVDEYRKRHLFIGVVDGFSELDPLMDRYGINMAGIDYMPEWQQAAAFVNRFPGRAYRVGFLTGKAARQAAKLDVPMQVDDDERLALVRRTQILDATLDLYRRQWVMIPDLDELPEEYPSQMGAVLRVNEEDDTGKMNVFYRSTGDDDFALSACYDVMATELWYRQRGLEAVLLAQQPTATADAIGYTASGLADTDSGSDEVYRPGFADRDEFGGPFDG
jgi:hypothetical protein